MTGGTATSRPGFSLADMKAGLAFGLETVPDVAGLRLAYELKSSLSDADVADYAFQRQRAFTGVDDLPFHFQKVVAVCWVLFDSEGLKFESYAGPALGEGELLRRLDEQLKSGSCIKVAWNGRARELPILKNRALLYPRSGLDFRSVAEEGGGVEDLAAFLAVPAPHILSARDELVRMMGGRCPVAMDVFGTWLAWSAGRYADVRAQCEAGALKTALLTLRHVSWGDDAGLEADLRARLASLGG